MKRVLKRLFYSLIGLALLPLAAGLTRGLFEILVSLQSGGTAPLALWHFLAGALAHLLLFLFLPKALRSYVLAHELSHAIAAWLSGARAGHLKVGRDGGSVEVSSTSLFICLAPYLLPFYSILVLLGTLLAGIWLDLSPWLPCIPFALGFTGSHHFCYTLLALSLGQSDLDDFGILGAYPVLYIGNLLLILAGLLLLTPPPLTDTLRTLAHAAIHFYQLPGQ